MFFWADLVAKVFRQPLPRQGCASQPQPRAWLISADDMRVERGDDSLGVLRFSFILLPIIRVPFVTEEVEVRSTYVFDHRTVNR